MKELHHHDEHCSCCHETAGGDECACCHPLAKLNEPKRQSKLFTVQNALTAAGLILFVFALIFRNENRWIALVQFAIPYLLIGYKVLWRCAKNVSRGRIFDENLLMTLASVGAFALGEYFEAVAVMIFYEIGERFQDYAVDQSVQRVKDMLNVIPDTATRLEGGEPVKVKSGELVPGDVILVRTGERVPADAKLLSESALFDTASLTGESVPRDAVCGDAVLSGFINTGGVITAEVTKIASESSASKVLQLVEQASERKSKSEQFITRFSRIYTPIVTLAAVFVAFLLPVLTGQAYNTYYKTALIFLLVSCPCALVISIPLSYFTGIGACAKAGALLKGGNYLATLNQADVCVFDKTGTLTEGSFSVREVLPQEDCPREKLESLLVAAESQSNHPIAQSVLAAFSEPVEFADISEYREVAGGGVSVCYRGHALLAGKAAFLRENGVGFAPVSTPYTAVHLAEDGVYLGSVTLADRVKPDAADVLRRLKKSGVRRTVMLTGDNRGVAEAVAKELGIDEVRSELLPDEKLNEVERLVLDNKRGKTVYVGDGINDVLALARADVGVAAGTVGDAAMASADVVIASQSLKPLASAKRVSGQVHRVVWENIVFSLAVKFAVMVLGFTVAMPLFVAILADVGCSLLAVLNALRCAKK